jgi:hypothetical protein
MGFVYILTAPNGKAYVGQTTRHPEQRLKEHVKCDACLLIHQALNKYGVENFDVDWLEVPDAELDKYERLIIEKLDCMSPNGYNLVGGGCLNRSVSDETRAKMSAAMKARLAREGTAKQLNAVLERWKDPDARTTMAGLSKTRWDDPLVRAKMTDAIKVRMATPEARSRMAELMRARMANPEKRAKVAQASKTRWADPEARARHSEMMKALWDDPAFRERMAQRKRKGHGN